MNERTAAQVLAGSPEYRATGGCATFKGQDLLALAPEERGRLGLFLRCWQATRWRGGTEAGPGGEGGREGMGGRQRFEGLVDGAG